MGWLGGYAEGLVFLLAVKLGLYLGLMRCGSEVIGRSSWLWMGR